VTRQGTNRVTHQETDRVTQGTYNSNILFCFHKNL
jgi:hypothetical protein